MLSELSILEDDLERLRLLVWLVETLAFTRPSDRSTLEELFERLLEVVLMAVRSTSILEEELESERLDV